MTDVADLCERAKVWLESNSVCPDWVSEQRKLVQWVREAAAALPRLSAERDEADRDCSLIIGWAAAADGEPDVMLTEFHALRHRIAELEGEVVRVDSGWTESRASAADAGMALRTAAAAAAAAIDCDHSVYIHELDGRRCPRCGVTMVDPGD